MNLYKPVMCRYSPIAPISLLESLEEKDLLGNYLLVLAHDVYAHTSRYAELLHKMREKDPTTFVILDNSAIELDEPVDIRAPEYQAAVEGLAINAFAVPDVVGDGEGTRKKINECWDTIRSLSERAHPMFIPQGNDMFELCQFVDDYTELSKELANTPIWGVPRWVTNKLGSRIPLVQVINSMLRARNIEDEYKIHLLGMSQVFSDDIRCTGLPNVIGIDSANPVTLGQYGRRMSKMNPIEHRDRGSLWDQVFVTESTKENIVYVRKSIEDMHPDVDSNAT